MKDLKHYLALATILSLGFAAFWVFNYNRQAQIGVTLVISSAYVLWGMVHHYLSKELHWRIILEYLLVAVVASVAVIFLLLRS